MTADEQLRLAKGHLERVQAAWHEPDWQDLAFTGSIALSAPSLLRPCTPAYR